MKPTMIILCLFLVAVTAAGAAVQGREVDYSHNGTVLKGYLAYDDTATGKGPGILVVHEWWGHNDYARQRARVLAGLGYTALAVDMYGGGRQADHPDDAGRFAGSLRKNLPLARARFLAALELLRGQSSVDAAQTAAIGYCFGGGVVLEMARAGIDLDGVVSFHGSLATGNPARPGVVVARVLVLNGAADPLVTSAQIAAFKGEMASAGVDYRFINYEGARHSFTNPEADRVAERFGLPLAYSRQADEQSWLEMQRFFGEIFR